MAGEGVAERADLMRSFEELVSRLSEFRDSENVDRVFALVERLAVPAAAFLQPDLEQVLSRFAEGGDTFGRDRIAHVLASSCGVSAMPCLLRTTVHDRNEDVDLQSDVLGLILFAPVEALSHARICLASAAPRQRRIGVWILSVIFNASPEENIEVVVEAAGDEDAGVRSEVMDLLGTLFEAGDPRALAVLMAGIRDAEPGVRRSAVHSLGAWRGAEVTEALVSCLEDFDRSVRVRLAWSLINRPGLQVRTALEKLAVDPDADVRAAARRVAELRGRNRRRIAS